MYAQGGFAQDGGNEPRIRAQFPERDIARVPLPAKGFQEPPIVGIRFPRDIHEW